MSASFCGHCGARLDEGAKFCAACGRALTDAASAAAASPEPHAAGTDRDAPPPAAAATPSSPGPSVPPGEAIASRPVGLATRSLATAIDAAVLIGVALAARPSAQAMAIGAVAYFVVLWTLGGTIGMRALGIRLANVAGERPGPFSAVRRLLMLPVATAILGLGLLWSAFDGRGQGWHDKVAGTFVVRGRGAVGRRTSGAAARLAGALAGLVLMLALLGGVAAAYVYAPDIPPSSFAVPSYEDLVIAVPLLHATLSQPKPDPYIDSQAKALATRPVTPTTPDAGSPVAAALTRAGVRTTGAAIVTTAGGEKVLTVGVDVTAGSDSGGLAESYDAVLKLASSKDIDLRGLHDVAVGVVDKEGRVLVSVAAPASSVQQFREGRISRKEFLKTTAIRGESRAGAIDLIRQQLGGK